MWRPGLVVLVIALALAADGEDRLDFIGPHTRALRKARVYDRTLDVPCGLHISTTLDDVRAAFVADTGARLVVYTVITGAYDTFRMPLGWTDRSLAGNNGVRMVIFVDEQTMASSALNALWESKFPALRIFILTKLPDTVAARVARTPKLMPHMLFPGVEHTLYFDAKYQITADPWDIVRAHQSANSIVTLVRAHGAPECPISDEFRETIKYLHNNEVTRDITDQLRQYTAEGYIAEQRGGGLFDTAIILSNLTSPDVTRFYCLWLSECYVYSHREQLSFGYVWDRGLDGLRDFSVTDFVAAHQFVHVGHKKPSTNVPSAYVRYAALAAAAGAASAVLAFWGLCCVASGRCLCCCCVRVDHRVHDRKHLVVAYRRNYRE